ncbi:TonB-dependent receptor [Lysobacter sp. CFH 32150]|uniref:TonB-dependent receptor n=1 Tax=Lysobacter sp. CFH 32150 TaxID=2927128 RepID=UPI001FA7A48D|nr:TonB-dependent receptor [Lysobacter sp. CFH 32150]MCI4566523.1 TonB-dependent receptor [Lysobacter sp. CFH 32150]
MSPRKNRLAVSLSLALSGCAALMAAPQALAQDAPAASETPQQKAASLDTIVVTAQSREQELQDVPIALQVLDEQMLDDVAAEDLSDIDSFVPGLVVNGVQPTQPSIKLRGIETDDFGIGTDPAVGIFVDGVYGGRGGGVLLPFIDVERIEVLKGPQGTLFGRNTAAGAISLITRRPQQDHVEARAKLRIGNYGKQYAEAMWNIPTGDNSAFRLNALINHSDGWVQDGATGADLGGENTWATRAAWQVRMGDNTTAYLSWDHESLDQNGRVTTGIVPLPPAPARPPAPANPRDYFDPRDASTFSDAETSAEWRTFDGVSLIVDHSFAWGNLTSTTSWRQYDSLNQVEEDGTNRADLYIDSTNTEGNESFYQEFKFGGSNASVDWVAGVSYFKEDAEQTSEVNTNTDTVDNIVRNLGIAPTPDGSLYGFFTQVAQSFGIPVSLLGHSWNERFQNTLGTTAYAAFGDVIWHATDKLNVTVGLRYTRDEKEFSWLNNPRTAPGLDASLDALEALGFFDAVGVPKEMFIFDIAFIDPPAVANKGVTNSARKSWSDFSPRFVVDYHFSDKGMVFASLAKGYKAGGYNALQIGPSFDNEDVWNFEGGIKQSFANRFAYNASLFYYNYDNRQSVRLIDPDPTNPNDIPRFVIDTGDLEAWGVDFDARWQVTDAFGFDVQAEWIDSTYKKYTTPEGVNLDGQPTGEPNLSASLGANYVFHLGDNGGDLRLSARHAYRAKRRCNDGSELQGDCSVSAALDLGEAQERTDLRVGWTSARGHWGWAVYGNNVFDNRYVTGLNTYGKDVLGVVGAMVSEPRTYGLEITVKY